MERLTARMNDGTAFVCSETGTEGVGHHTTQRRLPELIARLAAYEDAKLTPNQCMELARENIPTALDKLVAYESAAPLEMVQAWAKAHEEGRMEIRTPG